MAETRVRQAGEDRLSEVEIAALRARFEQESEEAITLSALAEAAGMDRETVREHLRQIRTERAFQATATPPKSADRPNWYWAAVGGVALVVAGAVTYKRIQMERPVEYVMEKPPNTQVPRQSSLNTRQPKQPNMLPQYSDGKVGLAPVGFEVLVAIPNRMQTNPYQVGNLVPRPYAAQRDGIIRSIMEMVVHAHAENARFPEGFQRQELKPPFMDAHQNTFDLPAGYFHYAVKGWAGRISGELKYPIGQAEKVRLRQAVEKMLQDEKQAQDQALGAPPRKGIVSPPPGYRIQFGGRRLDVQEGPKLAFAPVPLGLVQSRLEAALINAVKRDSEMPEGRWEKNAQADRKIPHPKRYAGSIEGPGGVVPYDFPASPPSAVKQGIRDVAARAAAQMGPVNTQSGIQVRLNGTAGN